MHECYPRGAVSRMDGLMRIHLIPRPGSQGHPVESPHLPTLIANTISPHVRPIKNAYGSLDNHVILHKQDEIYTYRLIRSPLDIHYQVLGCTPSKQFRNG